MLRLVNSRDVLVALRFFEIGGARSQVPSRAETVEECSLLDGVSRCGASAPPAGQRPLARVLFRVHDQVLDWFSHDGLRPGLLLSSRLFAGHQGLMQLLHVGGFRVRIPLVAKKEFK